MERMEIICPAGTPAALKTAIESGADTIYCGFNDETNARNFPGLNFSKAELHEANKLCQENNVNLLVALNTYPQAGKIHLWQRRIADCSEIGVHAVILCDIGLLQYSMTNFPHLRRHLSVQASASNPESVKWYVETFDIKRVVLPRVTTVDQIKDIAKEVDADIEVFVYGGLCVMAEGRCSLSSYITGKSPNINGVCSPASHVSYDEEDDELVSKLGEFTINKFEQGENAGYPTLCKGKFITGEDNISYLFEDPISLNVVELLPELAAAGVTALKIEGRQRGKAYTKQVVKAFKQATIDVANGHKTNIDLANLSEGQTETQGAYNKRWK